MSSNRQSAIGDRQSSFWLVISLLALFAAAKPILCDTLDPDCFWHLKVAEQLHHDGIGPIVDRLSFDSIKTPWTPYSWLAELGMKAIWDLSGFRAAIATQALLQAGFVVLLALCGRTRRPGNPLAVIVAVAIGLFYSMPYLSFRPVTLAIDLIALITWIVLSDDSLSLVLAGEGGGEGLDGAGDSGRRDARCARPLTLTLSPEYEGEGTRNAIWLVVPITAVLTNVHFFAFLVPLIFAARIAGNWVARQSTKRDLLLLIATSLACCATPMLPGTLTAMWHYQFADAAVSHRLAAEFAPIYAGSMGGLNVSLLGLWAIAMLRSRLAIGEKLWAAGFAVLMLRMGRFAPVFAPIGVATIAFLLPKMSGHVLERLVIRVALIIVLSFGLIRVVASFPRSGVTLSAWLNRNGPETPGYPTAAADYVVAHVPPGRLLNDFSWGGYLEWRLGEAHPVLIDGRTQLFTPQTWADVATGDFSGLMATPATAAIVPVNGDALRHALVAAGWRMAYRDDRAQVLVPGQWADDR